jgi:hypothetical protein
VLAARSNALLAVDRSLEVQTQWPCWIGLTHEDGLELLLGKKERNKDTQEEGKGQKKMGLDCWERKKPKKVKVRD